MEIVCTNRRQLLRGGLALTGLGLATACGLMPVPPRPPTAPRRVGYLAVGTPASAEVNLGAFRRGLNELGLLEGRGITLEVRYADGREERLPDLAAELVRQGVEVVLTDGNLGIRAARGATTTVPIVFTIRQGRLPISSDRSTALDSRSLCGRYTRTSPEDIAARFGPGARSETGSDIPPRFNVSPHPPSLQPLTYERISAILPSRKR